MSKKSFTILIIIAVILAFIALFFFLYKNAQKNNPGEQITIRDLFPFGPGTPSVTPSGTGSTGEPSNPDQNPPATGSTARLRKVSETPVTGYTTLQKQVPVDPNSIPAPKQVTVTTSYAFTKTLKSGDKGADVTELQKFLNQCPQTRIATTGAGSPGKEGTVYGPTTVKAVTAFQELFSDEILKPQNLTKGTGAVDEATLKKIQAGFVCTYPVETPETVLKDVVRYAVRGTSNIFDAFADTLATRRLSSTTIPRVHEAFFADQGKTVFLRSLQADNLTIDTLIGKITEPIVGGDSLPELSVLSMPKNITDLTISPDGKQILFLLPSGTNLLGFISDLDGKNQQRVFSSPFSGWLSQWSTSGKLIFTIKATGYATGFSYSTDIAKGDFTKVAGPITGLTTLASPDGKYLLISRNTASGPALAIMDVQTKNTRGLGLNTLPEKCVWSTNSLSIYCAVPTAIPADHVYPDDWYQGTVAFNDSFWLIDATGVYDNQLLFSPIPEGGEATDGVRLYVDATNKYLYFINRNTDILWQYDLTPAVETVI